VRLATPFDVPQSYVTVRGGDPVAMLPLGLSTREVATECRSATIAFLRGSGWGKRELAAWLVGRYRPLCALARGHAEPRPATGRPAGLAKCDASLPLVLRAARRSVVASIHAALVSEGWGDPGLVDPSLREGMAAGHVLPVEDHLGEPGWVPADRPRMRLADRVASLALAHRLTAPGEFVESWAGLSELADEVRLDDAWTADDLPAYR
jgi:hypothetical protein